MIGMVCASRWGSHSKMNRLRRALPLTIGLLLVFGFAACDPEEETIATFPHKPHIEFDMSCDMCHEVTDDKVTMPDMFSCTTCHELEDEEVFGDCMKCHEQNDVTMTEDSVAYHGDFLKQFLPEGYQDLQYDHASYPVDGQEGCLECHGHVTESMGSTAKNIPSMQTSMAVHDELGYSNECSVCHMELNEFTPPASHDSHWPETHGRMMDFQDRDECLWCHQEETCFTCHSVQKPRNHNNLFRRKTHGILASFDRGRCLVCHRNDECMVCHQASADPVPPAPYHTPDASCLSCHSRGAAMGPAPRPADRFIKPMPHRMMMGVSAQRCLECHMF